MTRRLLHIVLIGAIMLPAAVATSDADTRWQRVAPEGAGFSVEVTGRPDPKSVPGDYQYQAGLWFLAVKVGPVEPVLRQLLERRDRKDAQNCLERIRDTVLEGIQAKRHDSSFAEIQGYPAIRFSFEFSADGVDLAGTNLLVLTPDRFYTVMAVGPKGLPDTDARRFVRSFRLVATDSAAPESVASTAPSANPLALKLAPQALAVARLIIGDRMNPQFDEVVQKAPPAEHLGARWNPSTAAWQQARQSFTGRIDRLVKLYEKSGQLTRTIESELNQLSSESQATLTAALNGPAGPAILHQLAQSQFVSMMMVRDVDGPQPGDRAWVEKRRSLQTLFDQRIGSALPATDRAHDTEARAFFATLSDDVPHRLLEVVETVTQELETAIELCLVDDSEAIRREIESAIASVKLGI